MVKKCSLCRDRRAKRFCPNLKARLCPSCCAIRRSNEHCTKEHCLYGIEKTWIEDSPVGKIWHRITLSSSASAARAEIRAELLAWCERPLEALDGKTPLEAVKTPEGRKKVREIIEQVEEKSQRISASMGMQPLDYSEVKKKLGIT